MARTGAQRPGHSRKAQFGIFGGYVAAGLGALIGAVLLIVSLLRPDAFDGVRGEARDAVNMPAEATAVARTESKGLIEAISGYYQAGRQNAALRREMELARIRLAEADAMRLENDRLRGLLALREEDEEPVATARLVGSTASSTRRFAYLGAGAKDGVLRGMPVRSARGVVGRVLEVGDVSSRVLLLTDTESVLPVRLAREDIAAFAEGRGDGLLNIRLINLGLNPIKRGDVFVTSGAGGFYKPGIAVAIASEITSDGAVARLISDPAATDFVAVERIWQPEAVDAARTPNEEVLGE